jgi:hypothetical protein
MTVRANVVSNGPNEETGWACACERPGQVAVLGSFSNPQLGTNIAHGFVRLCSVDSVITSFLFGRYWCILLNVLLVL